MAGGGEGGFAAMIGGLTAFPYVIGSRPVNSVFPCSLTML